MARGHKGDFAYENTGNALLEFFSKAGSLFKNKGTYHGDETTALELFKGAWATNNHKAMQLAMWVRDCRGGSGNRSGFEDIINWLANKDSKWVLANMHFIPLVGRWKDLEALLDTPCEDEALKFWVRAIQDGNGLAAKWAPRSSKVNEKRKIAFNKLRKVAGMPPKDFRKLLSKNTDVVESRMCSKDWQDIDYSKVPSVAMARYNSAFGKNDGPRFSGWKGALEKGVDEEGNEVKVNAEVLFPHDVIRTLKSDIGDAYTDGNQYYGWDDESRRKDDTKFSDSKLANAQFKALPDYLEGTGQRVMSICDFSGSMCVPVSGSIMAIDVSMGLGLYCSDRLGESNPFYRKFIPFSDNSRLVDWKDETFSVAAQKHNDGWCGSTNVRSALNQILEAAKMFGASDEQIPNTLLIVSDMQWDQGTGNENETSVEAGLKAWEETGYSRPKVVYWNLSGYRTSPATVKCQDVALVSGFSPSLLKAIFGGEDFSPMAILEKAIEKYEVVDPKDVKKEEVE